MNTNNVRMTRPISIPQHTWETLSTDAQAVIAGVIGQLEQRIADLEERLNTNSTHSSKPPSSDPPSGKRLRRAVRQDLQRGAECSCAKTAATCRELRAGEPHLWTS